MMKKLFIAVFAALSLAACNTKLGPEYETPPVVSNVRYSASVGSDAAAKIEATVSSQYGLQIVQVAYYLDEENTEIKYSTPVYYSSTGQVTEKFTATIPKQEKAKKVTFQIAALNHVGIPGSSEVFTYEITEAPVQLPEN